MMNGREGGWGLARGQVEDWEWWNWGGGGGIEDKGRLVWEGEGWR